MKTFIISRTDAIGDVVLTLPVAGVLRSLYPSARILFLGRAYTRDIIDACTHIDGFLDWDQLKDDPPSTSSKPSSATSPKPSPAEKLAATGADTIIHVFPNKQIARAAWQARIPQRIGTTNRLYHWLYCNVRTALSRKNSPWHEAQLNLQLLKPLGAQKNYTLEEISGFYGLTRLVALPPAVAALLSPDRFNLILHPKSRGSAREWGLDNFRQLIALLPRERFNIFLTGTAAEGKLLEPLRQEFPFLTDLTGRLSLGELMSFIARADGLVAASTGPLHLAAALGINALGIYPPIRPMHPGRWAPVGKKAAVFVEKKDCDACRKTGDCACMRAIRPQVLSDYLQDKNHLFLQL